MNTETVSTIVRAFLKWGGGYLIAKGITSDAQWAELSGSLATVIGIVWGIVAARIAAKNKQATQPPTQ